jgi:uncharacterized protein (DUF433 family)
MYSLPITEEIPIRADENGRLRVGGTKVLLDLVVYAFRRGSTPETITDQYPALSLDDVYLALGYYLRHRAVIDEYLRYQEAQYEAERREHEATHPSTLTRDLLLERLRARQQGNK